MREQMLPVEVNENIETIIIPDIIFKNRQRIPWDKVEIYLQGIVGVYVKVKNTGDIIYIGRDFPEEYSGSKYTRALKGGNAKAKANAAQCIVELLENAFNRISSPNFKEKHSTRASQGWLYFTTRFALPVFAEDSESVSYNDYTGRFVVNHSRNGKLYLYDLVDIKKEASNPLKIRENQVVKNRFQSNYSP